MAESEMSYRAKADAAIRDIILDFECQPILFIGSGISKRYFGAPNWIELLQAVFKLIPDGANLFEYHRQKFDGNAIQIGSVLSDLVFEWAWKEGRARFPEEFFRSNVKKDCFLKHLVCSHIGEITPEILEVTDDILKLELSALADVKPHAIITTNYDLFLEKVFDGYETITGQKILKYNTNSFGEIYHIHGDISDAPSIVLTEGDYAEWGDKKKYVSAKLLTYFAEHPVFIFGYGLNDPNVKSILRDIGELVADESGLISNVYQIVWRSEAIEKHPPDQSIFSVDDREYRIRAIHTNELKWIFQALKSQSALTSINPKLVRALAARTLKLVRHDIPSGSVSVDYDVLERVASEKDFLPTLLGITAINNPNQSHPFTLTQIAQRMGLPTWHGVNNMVNQLRDQTGIDLKASDNKYHCKIKTGVKNSSMARKWSHEALSLFERMKDGQEFEVDL
jgi:hypothetical protein